jgi:hypothetical protein
MKFNQNPYGNSNGNYGGRNDFISGGGNYSNDPYDYDDDYTYSNPYGESNRYKPFRDFASTYPETRPLMRQPYFQEVLLNMSDNLHLKPDSYLKSVGHDLGLSDPTVSTYDLAQKEAKKYEDMYKSIPNQRENGSVSNTYYNAYLKANEKLDWLNKKKSERANKYYAPGIQNLQFTDLDNTESDDKHTNTNLSLPTDMLNAINDIANNDSYLQRFLEKKQQDNLNNLSPADNNMLLADAGMTKTDAGIGNNSSQQETRNYFTVFEPRIRVLEQIESDRHTAKQMTEMFTGKSFESFDSYFNNKKSLPEDVKKVSIETGIPEEAVKAMLYMETRFLGPLNKLFVGLKRTGADIAADVNLKSKDDISVGITQMKPSTAGRVDEHFHTPRRTTGQYLNMNQRESVKHASLYLKKLKHRYINEFYKNVTPDHPEWKSKQAEIQRVRSGQLNREDWARIISMYNTGFRAYPVNPAERQDGEYKWNDNYDGIVDNYLKHLRFLNH